MNRKIEIVLVLTGIILIVVGAYIAANLVHDEQMEIIEKNEPLKVGDEVVKFKVYRVDQLFFLQVPETFLTLDEATLNANYPTDDRPELVFQDAANETHIFVTTTNEAMTDDLLPSHVTNLQSTLTGFTTEDMSTYEKYGKVFVKLTGVDSTTNTYRDIRYFTLDNKLVIVEFNTLVAKEEDWKKASTLLLDAICFQENDVEKIDD